MKHQNSTLCCGQKEAQSWKEVLENEFDLTLYKVCYFMYISIPSIQNILFHR
jgi:hypothetical protein